MLFTGYKLKDLMMKWKNPGIEQQHVATVMWGSVIINVNLRVVPKVK